MAIKGSQGSIVFKIRHGMDVAVKRSKYNELCLELEAKVLQQISKDCPEVAEYFPKFVDLSDGKLTMSRIIDGEEFSEFIDRLLKTNCRSLRRKAPQIVKNLCCISLCALETVRRKTGVVHNDLHTSNVMIVKTDKEEVSFDFEKIYTFKTFGYFPIIFDFGYAHVEGDVVLGSLQNSDIGCTLEVQDLLADARLLLTTAKCNRELVRDIFGPLHLNGDGWFSKYTFTNVYDELYDIACKKSSRSMDAALTVAVHMMGDVKEDTSRPCCDTCYFTRDAENVVFSDDEEEFSDEEDEYVIEDKSPVCECCRELKSTFRELYDKREDRAILERAAVVFKPFVTRSLAHNRAIKEKEYAKLKVKTTLDVIDLII